MTTYEKLEALVARRRLERSPMGRQVLAHADIAAHEAGQLRDAEARLRTARAALARIELQAGPRGLRSLEATRAIADADRAVRAAEAEVTRHKLAVERAHLGAEAVCSLV